MATSTVLDARRGCWLDLVHQSRASHHWASLCATALAPRSELHRTSHMRSSLAHIDHLRRRRRLAAPGRERHELLRDIWSGALHEVAEVALAVRSAGSVGALAPCAGASASPGTADGRSVAALKNATSESKPRRPALQLPPKTHWGPQECLELALGAPEADQPPRSQARESCQARARESCQAFRCPV